MMKKIVTLLAVAAMTCFSTSAFAVHIEEGAGTVSGSKSNITIGGSVDVRSRDFQDLDMIKNNGTGGNQRDTQERIRLDVNVKAGDVQGKVTIENDWDTWGRFEAPQANAANNSGTSGTLDLREAWMLFPLPGTPIMVKGGHMLLQLGNGWWFRSMKYGSDAWVAFTDIDPVHIGLVNVKVAEGATSQWDDIDAYVLFAAVKINDNVKVGGDVTYALDRRNGLAFGGLASTKETEAFNFGLNADVKAGIVGLKVEADVQTGKAKADDSKFKGGQVVVQGNVGLEPLTINFAAAYGTGEKATDKDHKEMVTLLDADQHYTLLYEYKIGNPSCADAVHAGGLHAGFCNTTAVSGGVMVQPTPSLGFGVDLWWLAASEKVPDVTTPALNDDTNELGLEVDVKINWTLAENLTWNWTLGYLDPGKGLGKDAAMGAQGVLSMKF